MAQEIKVQSTSTGLAFGITSLATGTLAFLTGWIFFLSIPLGAIAVVFGALGLRRAGNKGLAIAGLVSGIVGLAFGLGLLAIAIVSAALNPEPEPTVFSHSQTRLY